MNVTLRAVREGDLDAFFEHQRDPAATAMADFPPRDRAAFDAHWAKLLRDGSVVARTIVVNAGRRRQPGQLPRRGPVLEKCGFVRRGIRDGRIILELAERDR